jgi:hypothetical protein
MSTQRSRSHLVARRAELMAELFLVDLGPQFLSRPTDDLGYDLLVGFLNTEGGINTFAVEVKSTERPLTRFQLPRRSLERVVKSNIPGLLLVADVKQNRMYYAWLSDDGNGDDQSVSIPLTEVTEATQAELQRQLESPSARVAAAG